MPVFVALLVIDVVLLVDAFTAFGITDAFELRLGRYILLKIAATEPGRKLRRQSSGG